MKTKTFAVQLEGSMSIRLTDTTTGTSITCIVDVESNDRIDTIMKESYMFRKNTGYIYDESNATLIVRYK